MLRSWDEPPVHDPRRATVTSVATWPPPRPSHHPGHRPTKRYTADMACAHAGITYRQLDHWLRLGVFSGYPPGQSFPGNGAWREWTRNHAYLARLIARSAEASRPLNGGSGGSMAMYRGVVDALVDAGFPSYGCLLVRHDEVRVVSPVAVATWLAEDGRAWIVVPITPADHHR